MGFFGKKVKNRQLSDLATKAQAKLPKRSVKLSSDNHRQDYIKLVVDTALKSLINMVSQRIRDEYSGEVRIKEVGGDALITVTLTHIKQGRVIVQEGLVSHNKIKAGIQYEARDTGRRLATKLAAQLHRADGGSTTTVKPPKPDMTEAMEVAKLLDLTRCALCGYADLDYPDWGDVCSHTPEERAGD